MDGTVFYVKNSNFEQRFKPLSYFRRTEPKGLVLMFVSFFLADFILLETMTWGIRAVFATYNIILAEFIWRILRILLEYNKYSRHYPFKNKLQTVLKYGLHFPYLAYCFLAAIVAISIAIVSSQYETIHLSAIYERFMEQSYLMLLWWLIRIAEFSKSMFEYADFIRSNSGLDYATGMASNYFHGYLLFTLPTQDQLKGIAERMEQYEDIHGVQFAIKRLVILIPNSLHTKPIIKSPLMDKQKPLEAVKKDRAGVSRPFTNDVYRLLIDGQPYYLSVEGATPLLSYFDSLNSNLTSTNQMKAMQREIMLKFYRYLKTILEKWPATQGQCELVFYNDYTADGQPQDVGEVLCTHIKEIWRKGRQ